jgi:hypothetical protein
VANHQSVQHAIPVGTNEPQDFLLKNSGVPFDGSGCTIALEIKLYFNNTTTVVASPPSIAWLDQAGGKVRVTGVAALAIGNYLVRYKVTDAFGNIGYFPNGDKADLWRVVPIASI